MALAASSISSVASGRPYMMFSRMVPRNSQVSWRTIPISDRSGSAAHLRDVDVVEGDPAGVELVEPHDQVDQGRLAGPGRPDGHRLRLDPQREVLDEGRSSSYRK